MTQSMKPLLLALAAALALSACGKKEEAQTATTVIKIGQASPLTGPQAHLGKDNENGVRLALDEANAKGVMIGGQKVSFQIISQDDQADPKQGTLVAQSLVDAGVSGVIGHLNSGTTIPASRIYFNAGLPQVSPSATNPKYTQQGFKTAFRVMANDVQQGKALANFAMEKLHAKAIAVIDDRTAYGQGLADEFQKAVEAAGGKIVAREFTNDKATDFTAILTKVKSMTPDLVFYGGMDAQAGPMARQIKSLGVKAPMLFGDGGCTTEFSKLAGDAAEGNYCSLPGVPLEKMAGGADFKIRYQDKFHTDIQLYAPYAYDAANVMIEAMKKANSTDPARYLPVLAKTDYPGVTGHIVFDAKGDLLNGAITLYLSKGGKWEPQVTEGGGDFSPKALADSLNKAADGVASAAPVSAKAVALEGAKDVEAAAKAPVQNH